MTQTDYSTQLILPARRRPYGIAKRVLDLGLAVVALSLAAPVMLLLALIIKLDSPGPVLFKQKRLGMGGKPFYMLKFRSMRNNVDQALHQQYVQAFIRNQLDTSNAENGSKARFKIARDPRITRIGHFIRKTSLDELPQLFNVLRGEMSLVGPRPPLPYEVEAYQEWHWGRLDVIPGMTGWWQVWGRSMVSFDEMVRMDLQYIAKQSLLLDLKIMIMTIPAVLLSRGAR